MTRLGIRVCCLIVAVCVVLVHGFSTPAYAETVDLACSAGVKLPNGTHDSTVDLYVSIDTIASTVTWWLPSYREGAWTRPAIITDGTVTWETKNPLESTAFTFDRKSGSLTSKSSHDSPRPTQRDCRSAMSSSAHN